MVSRLLSFRKGKYQRGAVKSKEIPYRRSTQKPAIGYREVFYAYFCYREFVSLLPSVEVNSLLPTPVNPVDLIVSCPSKAGVDDVTSSDAISVNAAGPGTLSARLVFVRGEGFLRAAFFLPFLRTLDIDFFFMLLFLLVFERFARFPFFCLLLAFAITFSNICRLFLNLIFFSQVERVCKKFFKISGLHIYNNMYTNYFINSKLCDAALQKSVLSVIILQ